MAQEKKQTPQDQEIIKPNERKQEELSEQDLGEASGGGLVFEKWIQINKV